MSSARGSKLYNAIENVDQRIKQMYNEIENGLDVISFIIFIK